MSKDGSSDSDSGGAGEPEGVGVCIPVADRLGGRKAALRADTAIGLVAVGSVTRSVSTGSAAGFGAGVSSTVEWTPVVHGGMERNSSNVRTLGLQHVQPKKRETHQSIN